MPSLLSPLRRILVETKSPDAEDMRLVNRACEALAGKIAAADIPAAAELATWALGTENFGPEDLVGLPPRVIRAMLRHPDATHQHVVFLASCVGKTRADTVLLGQWRTALRALEVFRVAEIYGLSSKKEAQIPLAAQSRSARVVAAARETALACKQVSAALLAILVLDGAGPSLAALEPWLRASTHGNEALDLMRKLEPLGRGAPPVKALLARVKEGALKRSESSGAHAVLAAAGIEGVAAFWLQLELRSVDEVKPYPRLPPSPMVRVALRVDSGDVHWFWAVVDAAPFQPALCFGDAGVTVNRKKLPVGGCAAEALPSWLSVLATKLKLTWDWRGMSLKTSLRAKKRERLEAWLRG